MAREVVYQNDNNDYEEGCSITIEQEGDRLWCRESGNSVMGDE